MRRVEATKRLLALIERVCAGGEFAEMVDAVYVFGSYARGALEVGDVDLSISYTRTEEEQERFREAALRWRDRELDFARALSGGARSLQLQFGNVEELRAHGFAPQLLWRRGEPLAAAQARIEAIRADPRVGTAARDPVIAPIEGLQALIARPLRETLALLDWLGVLRIKRINLAEGAPENARVRELIERTWAERNPKRRAALAAAAYLERVERLELDFDNNRLCTLELTEHAFAETQIAKAIVYYGRELGEAVAMLGQGLEFSLCVLNASAGRAPLVALRLAPRGRKKQAAALFRALEWGGEERDQLLARLQAAYDVGELPETLHAFAQSLRATRPS